jgi:hypothetical protein
MNAPANHVRFGVDATYSNWDQHHAGKVLAYLDVHS